MESRTAAASQTMGAAEGGRGPGAILGQADDLAADIVDEARISLMTAFRFMDVALWRMPVARKRMGFDMGSDGYLLYVDPLALISAYRKDPNEIVRDLLHAILHCVFRHPFDDRHPDRALWDLSCDIAVESCSIELASMRFPAKGDIERARALAVLKEACPRLTAHKVYNVLAVALSLEGSDERLRGSALPPALTPRFVESLPRLFARDDHGVWTREPERPPAQVTFDDKVQIIGVNDEVLHGERAELAEDEAQDDQKPALDMPGVAAPSAGGAASEGEVIGGDRFNDAEALSEGEAVFADMYGVPDADFDDVSWTDISQLISIEMEAFTGRAGVDSGTFEVNLSAANRKVYDYRDFLWRFSALSEEMKVSTEEFDYIYYTYGLTRYGNMPLVEPLEYQESNRVREFVIAIDTSASCAGGLVKHFVEKTFDVLKSTAAFGRKVNVHVVQCDCEVRKDVKITETADIDDSFAEFKARGFGGTDFRPVFKYVDDLVEAREFTNLKGMIYLTDGIGKYPESPPDYECAFVFVDEACQGRTVPPWAMKVLMTEDDILEL